jgi:hypothetical protein
LNERVDVDKFPGVFMNRKALKIFEKAKPYSISTARRKGLITRREAKYLKNYFVRFFCGVPREPIS